MSNTNNSDRPAAVPVGAASRGNSALDRQEDRFGGIKFGSAFFGWLTATGLAILLTALVTAVTAAIGLGASDSTEEAADGAAQNLDTIGVVGIILLVAIIAISYYCGGYVAGRMARFDGAKQGVAVWLWALIVAIVLAIIGAIAGSQFDNLSALSGVRIPSEVEAGSVVTAIVIALVSLGFAILGGRAGMNYHRRIDDATGVSR